MNLTETVFTGSILECLEHYNSTLPHEKANAIAGRVEFVKALDISDDRAYRYLTGKRAIPEDRLPSIGVFLTAKGYIITDSPNMPQTPPMSSTTKIVDVDRMLEAIAGNDAVLKLLASIVAAGYPLARLVLTNQFTDEQRRKLRELVPNDRLFELSAVLGALCSKQAREYFFVQNPNFLEEI